MECPICGRAIPENATVCPHCLGELTAKNDNAGKPAKHTAKSKRKTMEG